eukprot:scaffold8708_cov54-Phaeocystis_antarctica.AAC.1
MESARVMGPWGREAARKTEPAREMESVLHPSSTCPPPAPHLRPPPRRAAAHPSPPTPSQSRWGARPHSPR